MGRTVIKTFLFLTFSEILSLLRKIASRSLQKFFKFQHKWSVFNKNNFVDMSNLLDQKFKIPSR